MENTWAEVGKDCVCIRESWLRPAGVIGLILGIYERTDPAPKFMQTYRIVDIEILDTDSAGHRVKLAFNEFPGEHWCSCGFRPLEKIESEERKRTTAPVDLEKV